MHSIDYLIFIFLVFIFYQDYKYRAISWILFPIGFLLFAIESLQFHNFEEQSAFFLVNFGICLFVFISLTVYFSIKNKKFVNIIDTYIGIGDLLFILIVSLGFSAINFILFINLSLLFILFIYGLIAGLLKFNKDKIPFAGLLAIFYMIYYILNIYWFKLDPYVDLKIISYL